MTAMRLDHDLITDPKISGPRRDRRRTTASSPMGIATGLIWKPHSRNLDHDSMIAQPFAMPNRQTVGMFDHYVMASKAVRT
jgi:hypothetical protein